MVYFFPFLAEFLTIGIPSVRRPNTQRVYLYETLNSIINNTSEKDQNRTHVIVFLTDLNKTYNAGTERSLKHKFSKHLNNGFISIVKVGGDIYPDIDNVRKTFKDSKERLRWRAKQNIDFAYMFWYSSKISEYYIQLEDDVITASGFIGDIENFINVQNEHWFLLEFSKLGFIGKLFQSRDLKWIADFLFNRYDVLPCDLLLGTMRMTRDQKKPIHSNRSLFQHFGKFSSLKDKLMPSIDKTFKDFDHANVPLHDFPKGDNPPVRIKTNIVHYEGYRAENAYDNDTLNYFWGQRQKGKDYFLLLFEKPHNFSRIVIVTGEQNLRYDLLKSGQLRYSQQDPEVDDCGRFKVLAKFVDGEVDTLAQGSEIPDNITCLMIYVQKPSKTWLIIWRIEVFQKWN